MNKKTATGQTDTGESLAEMGRQLRLSAERLGFSTSDIARLTGLSRGSITAAFAGENITLSTLILLVRVLSISFLRIGVADVEFVARGVDGSIVRSALEKMEKGDRQYADAKSLLRQASSGDPEFRAEALRLMELARAEESPGSGKSTR